MAMGDDEVEDDGTMGSGMAAYDDNADDSNGGTGDSYDDDGDNDVGG